MLRHLRHIAAMLEAAERTLHGAGVATVMTFRVPGAYEIPVVAARLARPLQPGAAGRLARHALVQHRAVVHEGRVRRVRARLVGAPPFAAFEPVRPGTL